MTQSPTLPPTDQRTATQQAQRLADDYRADNDRLRRELALASRWARAWKQAFKRGRRLHRFLANEQAYRGAGLFQSMCDAEDANADLARAAVALRDAWRAERAYDAWACVTCGARFRTGHLAARLDLTHCLNCEELPALRAALDTAEQQRVAALAALAQVGGYVPNGGVGSSAMTDVLRQAGYDVVTDAGHFIRITKEHPDAAA